VCPSCGDHLYTAEYGCARCGTGRKSFLTRQAGWLPVLIALVGAGTAAFGVGAKRGP
jgi:hypothetical protein